MKIFKFAISVAALLAFSFASATPAHAGTVILEGSDAIGYHCANGQTGACDYRDQVWSAIAGPSTLPIAVFGNTVNGTPVAGSAAHAVADFSTVAAAGALNQYAALYFLAINGCCDENDSLITASGAQTDVAAYLAGGGTVMIENYIGGAAWDFAVGAGGLGHANTAGWDGGLPPSNGNDGETVTATGLANGFTQPPVLGTWSHQGYNEAFFAPLGFTLSFYNSDPSFAASNPTLGPFSSLLSNGLTKTGEAGAPEPASFALFGLGLLAIGVVRRARRV